MAASTSGEIPDNPGKIEKEYILFADESVQKDEYFSSFYGGVLVGASTYDVVTKRLENEKLKLRFHSEVKWSKVTEQYLQQYLGLMNSFFDEIEAGNIKIRIMFSQNSRKYAPLVLPDEEGKYFKLYYQFIKHAFGLRYVPYSKEGTYLRLYFDEFPDKRERAERFINFLYGLNDWEGFKAANLKIKREDIAEVRSHDHVLLQCLDVVLGSMAFRLNDRHRRKSAGMNRRGKRTIAKEKVYREINRRIRIIKPNFNCGITTGWDQGDESPWRGKYRHWLFTPNDMDFDPALTKSSNRREMKNRPSSPT